MQAPPDLLKQIFLAAVEACHPRCVMPAALPPRPGGRVLVIGAGKAAGAMAAMLEQAWGRVDGGIVVTRHGHGEALQSIRLIEARHPVPDETGLEAGARALALADSLGEGDTLVVLLSGGGSALLAAPLAPLDLADKQAVTRGLLLSGASIGEINCVRKHLSAIKGGRLAARAHPARVLTIAISDVAGDDLSVIASGPTVADPTTQAEAERVLARHGIDRSGAVRQVLSDPRLESVKPGDPRLAGAEFTIAARGADLVAAACDAAQAAGLNTMVLGVNVEGDARQVGFAHGEIARHMEPGSAPLLLLSGGELTVQVHGGGEGGRNREYLLALSRTLQGARRIWALAADSDGIDGSDTIAGGWIGPDTVTDAQAAGLDLKHLADRNDSARLFRTLGQEIVTGPTRTNVNDLRAILILPTG
jgi:hydroxypyruvate reductase